MELNAQQMDVLRELIDTGVARAACVLNSFMDAQVRLRIPSVKVATSTTFTSEISHKEKEKFSLIHLGFEGPFEGEAILAFSLKGGNTLAKILTGEESGSPGFQETKTEALIEVGNIVLNNVMGHISNLLGQNVIYTIPKYREEPIENLLISESMEILVAETRFSVEEFEIEGGIVLFFNPGAFDVALSELVNTMMLKGI